MSGGGYGSSPVLVKLGGIVSKSRLKHDGNLTELTHFIYNYKCTISFLKEIKSLRLPLIKEFRIVVTDDPLRELCSKSPLCCQRLPCPRPRSVAYATLWCPSFRALAILTTLPARPLDKLHKTNLSLTLYRCKLYLASKMPASRRT